MPSRVVRSLFLLAFIATALPAYAQQTGVIVGKVADSGGGVLPGVTVEARADVLPVPRVTTTGVNGEYRLVALPPGKYTLTFVLAGMQNVTRQAEVQLGQDTTVDATLGIQGVTEAVEVTATATMIEKESATIKSWCVEHADQRPSCRPGIPQPARFPAASLHAHARLLRGFRESALDRRRARAHRRLSRRRSADRRRRRPRARESACACTARSSRSSSKRSPKCPTRFAPRRATATWC